MYEPFVVDPATHVPDPELDVVIFPEFVDGDVGVYRSDKLFLKKRLVERGIRADYAFPPERRTWLREKSATQIAITLALGVGSSSFVAVAQYLLTNRDSDSQITVKMTRARKLRGRKMWDPEIVEITGTAEEVAKLVEELGEDDERA